VDELVSRILQDDASVRLATERYEKERALFQARRADLFPVLKTELFEALSTGEKTFLTYFDTAIEQPLFEGGKRLALKEEAEARTEKERLRVILTKRELEAFVRSTYARAIGEKELTEIAQEKVRVFKDLHEKEKKNYDQGLITKEKLLMRETKFFDAKRSLVMHKESLDYLLSVLQEMAGLSRGNALALEPIGDFPEMRPRFHFYLSKFGENPIYLIRRLNEQEKEFELQALKAERFPKLAVSARWKVNRDVFVDTNRGMIALTGKWNLWDFGRLSHEIEAKRHELEETRLEGVIETQRKERALRLAYHEARAAREKIRLEQALLKEREESFKNAKAREVAEAGSSQEAADSFAALEEAKEGYVQAITEYRLLLIRLEEALHEEIESGRGPEAKP
jgi:outer membrane protein TolC